jgi:hypothetical protein
VSPIDRDYVDVAERIVEFRNKYPDGSLQPADLGKPYSVEEIAGGTFIVVVAAAYRTADDTRPGVGMAQEPFPGRTAFTRGSELQNAETSAWGRAIVAALAADTKRGVSTAEEIRNRAEDLKNPLPDVQQHAQRRPSPAAEEPSPHDLNVIAAKYTNKWLYVETKDDVAALWGEAKEKANAASSIDVAGLLSEGDREVLGIAEGEPLTLSQLATKAGQYVVKFARAVRAPLDGAA